MSARHHREALAVLRGGVKRPGAAVRARANVSRAQQGVRQGWAAMRPASKGCCVRIV